MIVGFIFKSQRVSVYWNVGPLLAPAVTVGETEGAMDSASSSFAYNFVRK